MLNGTALKEQNKKIIYSQGFSKAGFTHCKPLVEEQERLNKWFSDGFAGPLDYLSQRSITDPHHVFPDAKTAIVVFFPYARPGAVPGIAADSLKLSRYLWGLDYHTILKSRLFKVLEHIQNLLPGTKGRVCVDTAPIMERKLAVQAGLGWQGKNTLLIAGKQGSWGFLGVLLLDAEFEPDPPFRGNRCGNCSKCVDSCPTGALEPFRLDCRHCLTTWNIERETDPPQCVSDAISKTGWVAGCDICQEVCPWNRTPAWGDSELWGNPSWLHTWPADKLSVTSRQWKKITNGTALRRVRFRHWILNLGRALGR
ncbi:MAG: tRNA epoxyqueuosine(34) reductase QueG [Holophagales bacterium]|jgi:epoxyqueuosine reductase|nr:tRNA epoxyqueuosine(34) reductase QueG [Holophagales bacterium]